MHVIGHEAVRSNSNVLKLSGLPKLQQDRIHYRVFRESPMPVRRA
jgi:hypothetical protein